MDSTPGSGAVAMILTSDSTVGATTTPSLRAMAGLILYDGRSEALVEGGE